jgi:hypothetical protein
MVKSEETRLPTRGRAQAAEPAVKPKYPDASKKKQRPANKGRVHKVRTRE